MKNIIKILFGLPAIMSIPLPAKEPPVDILLEGLAIHKDEGDCCISCGYNYCPSLDTCVRSWETYCQEFDFPYNALYKGAGIILPPKNKFLSNDIKNA